MDAGLTKLIGMAIRYLQAGVVWWKMPFVVILAYTFSFREILLRNQLFDSYPDPLPKYKQRCNDPVLGDGYLGCYSEYHLRLEGFRDDYNRRSTVTPMECVQHCKTRKFPYAALFRGKRCYCGMDYPITALSVECDCTKKCTGDRNKICGGSRHMSLYRTYFCTDSMKKARTIDGTCNDLNNSASGSKFYRFGRNADPKTLIFDDVLYPNPRELSRKFLKRRDGFKPVPWLNLLAVAWIQFTVHDWFDHGPNRYEDPIRIPLDTDDPLYKRLRGTMEVSRTRADPCKNGPGMPRTFQNLVTHWWDGSQIYGSDKDTELVVRSFRDGKLKVDDQGFLPVDPRTKIDITGFSQNWWSGLSLLHNTFTREHNSICDMLKQNNPSWTDQKLYDTARLINAALMAKIHTVEWTPAILNETFVDQAVKIQWFGTINNRTIDWLKQNNISISKGTIRSHIGNPANFHGVPFSLTEEFVAVYRMHPLIPDEINIWDTSTKTKTNRAYDLPEFSFGKARNMFDMNDLDDVLYTFGVEKAGKLVLRNYPVHLTDLQLPHHQGGRIVDVGTIDIVRDRERGVPRYNEFRRQMNLTSINSFDNLTSNTALAMELRQVYRNDIEKLDLMIGCLAEERPPGFGFGETAFQLFLLMANRRLMTDRFLTDHYNKDYYTQEGLDWVQRNTMKDVLLRNFADETSLKDVLKDVSNAFFVW